MDIFTFMIISLPLVASVAGIFFLSGRTRRKTMERGRAERVREANRPLEVWICRYCGCMSLMRIEVCSGCGSPRQEEFISRTILRKELEAQGRVGGVGAGKGDVAGLPDADEPAEFRKDRHALHPGR